MNWPKSRLELLAVDDPYAIVGGPFGSKLTSRDYVDYGVPVIRGSNLNNGRYLDMSQFAFVSETKVREDLSGNLARPGDLVFTQRGTLGQVAIIPDDGVSNYYVVSQSQMKLTVDDEKADTLFLYYYMSSREAIQRILNFASSSGVPHINLQTLRNFEVPVPPAERQISIASTLSAYDDQIENNRRRIQLLEQAGRLLYKEWFVHFRFPGHERVKIKDGLPEGWVRKPLFEIAAPTYGFAFKSSLFNTEGDGLPVTRIRDIPEGESQTYTIERAPEERLLKDGDFIIGMDGDFHMNFWTGGTAWINQRVVRIRGLGDFSDAFLRYTLEKPKRIEVLIPTKSILHEIQGSLRSVQSQIVVLSNQSRRAKKVRDLLLSPLMNGEVSIG